MADLRIVDAPEIPTKDITGEEKLPTGGNGNYSISLDSLADYTKTKKDLADNISVDNKVGGVRQELNTHTQNLLNPHQVTKGQIGLGNVDNTADADKPVSNSTQASIISAVAPKADKIYVDTALSSKTDKTYVDNQLTLKANKADVYTKSETYTKQESSDLVSSSISTALTPVNASLDLAKRGIVNRYDPSLTYNSGERVVLTNGDIVKSTVNGNANNPNVNMTGWVLDRSDSEITTWSGRTQEDENKDFISSIYDYSDLDDIAAENGRTVVVKKEGIAGSFTYKSDSVKIHNGGTVIKDALNRVWERQYSGIICGSWFEPTPDGVTDNTDKFTAASALGAVYLSGGNYKTNIIPFAQFFGDAELTVKNGTVVDTFKLTGSPSSFPDNILTYDDGTQELNTNLYIGFNSGRQSKGTEGMVTTVGHRTLEESGSSLTTERAVRVTAIGAHAVRRSKAPFSVVAVGDSALEHGEFMSRMVAVGSNALQFSGCTNPTLYKHEFMIAADQYGLAARNSGWRSIVGAMGSPIGLPASSDDSKESVAVGRNAMLHNIATKRDTAIGYNAMVHGWSTYDNVAMGNSALRDATATYTTVAVGSRSCELLQEGSANVAVGFQSFSKAVHLQSCTAIGTQALQNLSGNSTIATTARSNARQNTAVGAYAMQNTVSAVNMVAVGNAALQNVSGSQSVAVGVSAGSTLTTATNTTLVGYNAGTKTLGGSPTVSLTNSAALGYDAPLSGDNQIQLGNSATTTYVYGTVQNRSDARDKADIRDTELGLDFINSLRPVDYKWDIRDDYIETLEDGTVIKHDKDGRKKRNRYHHGFIAQEVPKGFGGYQDHKIQSGADVLSLGYDEFIAPLVKAIQELTQRVAELEAEKQK